LRQVTKLQGRKVEGGIDRKEGRKEGSKDIRKKKEVTL